MGRGILGRLALGFLGFLVFASVLSFAKNVCVRKDVVCPEAGISYQQCSCIKRPRVQILSAHFDPLIPVHDSLHTTTLKINIDRPIPSPLVRLDVFHGGMNLFGGAPPLNLTELLKDSNATWPLPLGESTIVYRRLFPKPGHGPFYFEISAEDPEDPEGYVLCFEGCFQPAWSSMTA